MFSSSLIMHNRESEGKLANFVLNLETIHKILHWYTGPRTSLNLKILPNTAAALMWIEPNFRGHPTLFQLSLKGDHHAMYILYSKLGAFVISYFRSTVAINFRLPFLPSGHIYTVIWPSYIYYGEKQYLSQNLASLILCCYSCHTISVGISIHMDQFSLFWFFLIPVTGLTRVV